MSVIAVESGLAQATMSPTTLPSMVVVDTTDTDGALDSDSLASEDVESSELEHATRDPAEAKAAAVKRASLCEVM